MHYTCSLRSPITLNNENHLTFLVPKESYLVFVHYLLSLINYLVNLEKFTKSERLVTEKSEQDLIFRHKLCSLAPKR